MITLENLLIDKQVIVELAFNLGFIEPRFYKAIYPDPQDNLYLLIESDANVLSQQRFQLNESQRIRYLELLLEREFNCTVMVRTKATLEQNMSKASFFELEQTAKAITESATAIVNYYGSNITFNKIKNTQVSEEELLDKETLNEIEMTKEEIKHIRNMTSAVEKNVTVSSKSHIDNTSFFNSETKSIPKTVQQLQAIIPQLKQEAANYSPTTKRQCAPIVIELIRQLKEIISLEDQERLALGHNKLQI